MKLAKLEISNFRNVGKKGLTVNFSEQISGIIGQNGSGKTTILEAANYLLGQDYLPSKISEKDFHSSAKEIKDEIVINGETDVPFFYEVETQSQTGQLVRLLIPCVGIKLSIKRREKQEKIIDDPFVINKVVVPVSGNITNDSYSAITLTSSLRSISSIKEVPQGYIAKFKLANGDERQSNIFSYQLTYNPSKLRNCPKAIYLGIARDRESFGNYSFMNKLMTDLDWRFKKQMASHQDTQQEAKSQYSELAHTIRQAVDQKETLVRAINEKIKAICSDDMGLQLDFVDMETPFQQAFISKNDDDKLLLPQHLGAGYNILLAYAILAYAAEQEKIPIVFIIDEPELHLHSNWQRRLYEAFSAQPQLQVIYATQSENFISLKRWRQVRSIRGGNVFPKLDILNEMVASTDGQQASRADYLDDYASKNLHVSSILRENLEFFFSEKAILVEGPAEKYSIPSLLSKASCNIEKYSVAIIPCWGKNKIKQYQTLCRAFGVDFFTLFDQDSDGRIQEANTAENNAIESLAQMGKVMKFSSSFEKLLLGTSSDSFGRVVARVDNVDSLAELNQEIQTAITKIKEYIEGNEND